MAKDFDKPRRGSSPRGGRSFDNRGGDDASRKSFKSKFSKKSGGDTGAGKPSFGGEKKSFGDRPKRDDKPTFGKREGGFERKKSFGDRGDKPGFKKREGGFGDRKSFGDKPGFKKREGGFGDKKSFGDRSDRPGFKKREGGFGGKKSFGDRSDKPGFKKREGGFERKKSFGDRDDRGTSRSFERRKPFSDHGDQPQRPERKFDDSKSTGKRPMRNFDKPVPEGGDKFFRGKPFGKSGARKRIGDEDRGERPERRSFVQSRVTRNRGVSVKKSDQVAQKPSDGTIRLNKFISNSGVCSRREADELIKMGLITVNGQSITEMGHKVKPGDDVRHEGKKLTAEKPVYILLNKPKGFITTTDDPQERKTVMGLIGNAVKERVYPVGRLDRNTTGLLLLTNDGELADKLTHPSYNAKKIYKAELDKPITKADVERIQEGVRLEEGKAVVDDLAVISDDKKTVGIEIHIGWNRIVRRIFESLGYEVVKLDRVVYAGLDKKSIGRGEWRHLKETEVVRLKHFGQQKTSPPSRGIAKLKEEED
jgi:23S rRNA pseudouridine2605 synthase